MPVDQGSCRLSLGMRVSRNRPHPSAGRAPAPAGVANLSFPNRPGFQRQPPQLRCSPGSGSKVSPWPSRSSTVTGTTCPSPRCLGPVTGAPRWGLWAGPSHVPLSESVRVAKGMEDADWPGPGQGPPVLTRPHEDGTGGTETSDVPWEGPVVTPASRRGEGRGRGEGPGLLSSTGSRRAQAGLGGVLWAHRKGSPRAGSPRPLGGCHLKGPGLAARAPHLTHLRRRRPGGERRAGRAASQSPDS